MTLFRCDAKSRQASLADGIHIGTAVKQKTHNCSVSFGSSNVQRRQSILPEESETTIRQEARARLFLGIDVSTMVQERARDGRMILPRGDMQGCPAILTTGQVKQRQHCGAHRVFIVRAGPAFQQQIDNGRMVLPHSDKQGCQPIFVNRGHAGAMFKKQLHHCRLTCEGSVMQRRFSILWSVDRALIQPHARQIRLQLAWPTAPTLAPRCRSSSAVIREPERAHMTSAANLFCTGSMLGKNVLHSKSAPLQPQP